jgi:putative addiction module component (TIGR02574 family)
MMLGGEIIMSERTAQLLQEVLALPPEERAEFSRLLWEHEDNELPETDPTEEEANYQLLLQRLAEVDAHPDKLIPGEQAMQEIFEYARAKKRP